jgi:hypothetical protein
MTMRDPHQEKLAELICCDGADIRVSRYIEWLCASVAGRAAAASSLVFALVHACTVRALLLAFFFLQLLQRIREPDDRRLSKP